MPPAADSRLYIRRWHSDVLLPADHRSPQAVRGHIDDALRAGLAQAAGAALEQAGLSGDELVFIRRLELDWAVDASWQAGAISAACAKAFARELVCEMASAEHDNVVRFSNRAAHVANYVAFRASHTGPAPWFHDAFAGWSLLPASAAIRSALCDDPPTGLAALRALTPAALEAVVNVLQSEDAELVTRYLQAPDATISIAELRSVLLLLADHPPSPAITSAPALSVWILARGTAAVPRATIAAASAIVTLTAEIGSAGGSRLPDVLRAIAEAEPILPALAAAATAHANDVVRALVARVAPGLGEQSMHARTASTRFGGGFLLLNDLFARTWTDGAPPLAALGLCLQGPQWVRVFDDAMWRELFQIPASVDINAISSELEVLAISADEILAAFAARLPGFAASSPDFLRQNVLGQSAVVDFEPDRIAVTLSRTPLHVILNLTGQTRGERVWPSLDARPFVLFTGN